MEDMCMIAWSYRTGFQSEELERLARDFFNSMDEDKDGKVSLSEFLGFMSEQGLIRMSNPQFFEALDIDNSKSLEFMEVMGLFYIIKSGRPFCRGCGHFISDIFFTCAKCFDTEEDSFCVCQTCFSNRNIAFHHHEPIHFLDNYALLEAKRKAAPALAPATAIALARQNTVQSSWPSRITELPRSASAFASTSTAIVQSNQPIPERLLRFKLFDAGLNALTNGVGNVAGAVAGAMTVAAMTAGGNCSIL